jgi:DNA-binding MarR family transcriptional regulator
LEENHNSIAKSISILHRYGQIFVSKSVEAHNIGSGQYVFLLSLFKEEGISQEKVSDYLKIDKATTARAMKKLESEGFIIREQDGMDKRAYKLFLTKKACDLKNEMEEIIGNWVDTVTKDFTENEKEIARIFLKRMAENAYASIPCCKDKNC